MKRVALSVAAMVTAGALAVTTFALMRLDDSGELCFTQDGDAAIAACTQAIQSGRFSGAELASIYDNRAIELRQQGDFDRAIADYTAAIRIDAELTGAYTGRGLAYEGKADAEKAKADYRKALALTQKYDDGQWAHDTARGRLQALGELGAATSSRATTQGVLD
jgi:tetratricopeptide (TPR) repeat protein